MSESINKKNCCCGITHGCGVLILGIGELLYLVATIAYTFHGFYLAYIQDPPIVA